MPSATAVLKVCDRQLISVRYMGRKDFIPTPTNQIAYEERTEMITEQVLMNASKFLRRVWVGQMDEEDFHNTLHSIESEIIKRRVEKANDTTTN